MELNGKNRMKRATSSAAILLLLQLICAAPTAIAQSASGNGWEQSFKAGMIDESTGKPIRGTEIVHLAAHKGRLYAGNSYWMDTRGYANIPWSQVLVLDSPDAAWKVDLALGPKHLRVTALQSVTLSTDGDGKSLAPPVNLLLEASTQTFFPQWTRPGFSALRSRRCSVLTLRRSPTT